MLFVEKYSNKSKIPEDAIIIDTTSHSDNWSRGLSPFLLNCGYLYDNYYAENVENAWQYCKIYKKHIDTEENPTQDYWDWAEWGWSDTYAHRYPMGKGKIPRYSLWEGEHLDYIHARKRIYIPLYSRVIYTEAFIRLYEVVHTALKENKDVYLLDFDAESFPNKEMKDTAFNEDGSYNVDVCTHLFINILLNKFKKMGHAYVLWALLLGIAFPFFDSKGQVKCDKCGHAKLMKLEQLFNRNTVFDNDTHYRNFICQGSDICCYYLGIL